MQATLHIRHLFACCVSTIPFLAPMLLMVGLLIAFPQIATWLPDLFYR